MADNTYRLSFNLSNGQSVSAGEITCPQGPIGPQGEVGPIGPTGLTALVYPGSVSVTNIGATTQTVTTANFNRTPAVGESFVLYMHDGANKPYATMAKVQSINTSTAKTTVQILGPTFALQGPIGAQALVATRTFLQTPVPEQEVLFIPGDLNRQPEVDEIFPVYFTDASDNTFLAMVRSTTSNSITGNAPNVGIIVSSVLITGPQGPRGIQGIQGPQGPQGEKGEPFSISKVYASVSAMNAGYATDGVPEGAFVVIDTGNVEDVDNAKLYYKGAKSYTYLTDLSGAQGMKGTDGREIQLQKTSTYLQWRYAGASTWTNLVALSEITGPQGIQGVKGETGAAAGFATPTATIDANVGTPSVEVTATGDNTAKKFNFAFKNMKGETGAQGPQGIQGETGPTGKQALMVTDIQSGSTVPSSTATIASGKFNRTPLANEPIWYLFKDTTTQYTYVLYGTIASISGGNVYISISQSQKITGEKGATGGTGPTGPTGPQGETGPQGVSIVGASLTKI